MSSVPSRILRYYDRVGLLKPAYLGSNGFRYYEREQLLLLRELGLGSGALAEVLDGQRDQVDALRRHERWLQVNATDLAGWPPPSPEPSSSCRADGR